jgi:hypothetical protein
MAALNNYTAIQAIDLYPTSGTTDDWLYGERGIASYTFEIGPPDGACGGFFPPYDCLDVNLDGAFWEPNRSALLYGLRVARAPYLQPGGPEVRNIAVMEVPGGIYVSATVDTSAADGSPILATEVYDQHSPWQDGKALLMQPLDGTFDSSVEAVYLVLPRESVSPDHLLLIRGRSASGWGSLWGTWAAPSTQWQIWLPFANNDSNVFTSAK